MTVGTFAVVLTPCALMGALSPLLVAMLAALGAALGLVARTGSPPSPRCVRITVDERALTVRVDQLAPQNEVGLVASVPLANDVRVVVTGSREGAALVEIVELRRGDETLVELCRHPDGVLQSFLFAPVEREINGLNAQIQASAARAVGAG